MALPPSPPSPDAAVLVFGYGSILWKQQFDYTRAHPCYVTGYRRLFHQGSRDHRGAPGKPGRVVTLLPAPAAAAATARVDGVAFELPADPARREAILRQLDVRERGGYTRAEVVVRSPKSGKPLELEGEYVCVCFMATEDNPDYLGEASEEEIAAQIVECEGMSGTNYEYIIKLAESLRAMGADDPHVFGIEEKVKKIHDSLKGK